MADGLDAHIPIILWDGGRTIPVWTVSSATFPFMCCFPPLPPGPTGDDILVWIRLFLRKPAASRYGKPIVKMSCWITKPGAGMMPASVSLRPSQPGRCLPR